MSDQTPDPTALDDDQLDDLLDALARRSEQRDDLDFPASGASRRGVLAGLLGLGGAATSVGVASAIGENESYGSSSGVVGTDSEPLSEANVQRLHAQDAQIDNLLEAEQTTARSSAVAAGVFFSKFDGITIVDDLGISNQGGNTTLSGTTGPDGQVSVSVDGNSLFVENRFGSQEKFAIYLFGS